MHTDVEPVRPFSEAFDFRRAAARSWAALKVAPLILWVGGVYRACTSGGGGGGDRSSSRHEALLDAVGGPPGGAWTAAGLPRPGALPELPRLAGLSGMDAGLLVLLVVAGLAAVALAYAFAAWLLPGWHRAQAAVFRTGTSEWRTFFTSFDAFPATFGFLLLRAGLIVGGALLVAGPFLAAELYGERDPALFLAALGWGAVWLPGLVYVFLGLAFADRLIAFEGAGVWEATRGSWRLVEGHRLELLLFGLLLGLGWLGFFLAGLLMLCVGLVVTVPLGNAFVDLCLTEAWLHLTRPHAETEGWAVRA